MFKSYIPYLQHILDECLYIRSVVTPEMLQEPFLMDVRRINSRYEQLSKPFH